MSSTELKQNRVNRWYFGGMASACAACVTHPLDLLKVALQTQQEGKLSVLQLTGKIVRQQGVTALYNGLSASLLRQLTYSTTRFGIYEVGKQALPADAGFVAKIMLAGSSGAIGGLIGTPADMVNVRMQNDVKLPKESRRKYVLTSIESTRNSSNIDFSFFSYIAVTRTPSTVCYASIATKAFVDCLPARARLLRVAS